jgi:hypothetical protein
VATVFPRLTRAYFRRWMRDNGRIVAALDRWYPKPVAQLLGVPRYLWREALTDAARLLTPSVAFAPADRFATTARLGWFAGYLSGSWHADPAMVVPPVPPTVVRSEAARVLQEH